MCFQNDEPDADPIEGVEYLSLGVPPLLEDDSMGGDVIFPPLPGGEDGLELEGEPESDAMEPEASGAAARGAATATLAAPDSAAVAAAAVAAGGVGRSAVPFQPPSSEREREASLTNRNSKRTHSKTRPTDRDSNGSDDSAGREGARPKRTHSQTRVAAAGRNMRQTDPEHTDQPDEDRYKARKRIPKATTPDSGSSSLGSSAKSSSKDRPEVKPAVAQQLQEVDLGGAFPSAAAKDASSVDVQGKPRPGVDVARARSAAGGGSGSGRTPPGPTGVAVHTYITLPGDVTRNQAVELLATSLKDMSIGATISMTNAGDVIIRHSSSGSMRREDSMERGDEFSPCKHTSNPHHNLIPRDGE